MITVSNFEDIGALIEVIGSEYVMDGTISKFVRIHKVTNSRFIIANAQDDNIFLQFNTNFNISAPVAVLDMDLNAEWFLGTVLVNDDMSFTFLTKEQMKRRGYITFIDNSLSLKVKLINELKESLNKTKLNYDRLQSVNRAIQNDLDLHKGLLEVEQIGNRELSASVTNLVSEKLSLQADVNYLQGLLNKNHYQEYLESDKARQTLIDSLYKTKCELEELRTAFSDISKENHKLRSVNLLLRNNNYDLQRIQKCFNVSFDEGTAIADAVKELTKITSFLNKSMEDITLKNNQPERKKNEFINDNCYW